MITGRILSRLPRTTVEDDLYWLRAFSALAGFLTLWVAWLGARECLGALGGATVVMLLALHPQFAIVSTAASPDAIVNLAGACVWWQAAVAMKRTRMLPLAPMWAAAIVATWMDRMGVPLLAFAVCVSAVVGIARVKASPWRLALTISAVAASALAAIAWVLTVFGTFDIDRISAATPLPSLPPWDAFARTSWLIHQSWWFSPGWGRYTPPSWWILIVATLTIVAIAGTARLLIRRSADAPTRKLLALAVIGVALQLAAVHAGIYLRLGVGPQGRYLLPLLVPSLVLLWSGIETWVPHSRRAHAAAALVLLLALLDAAAWMLVAVPAYYDSL